MTNEERDVQIIALLDQKMAALKAEMLTLMPMVRQHQRLVRQIEALKQVCEEFKEGLSV